MKPSVLVTLPCPLVDTVSVSSINCNEKAVPA